MSNSTELVRIGPAKSTKGPRVRLPYDVAAKPAIEVMTDEDKRHEDQLNNRAETPKEFFKRIPRVEPPLLPGASVKCETLLGFLAAMEKILPPESNYPILSSAKVWFEPGIQPRLFLEGGSHAVWTAIAIDAEQTTDKGFTAILPIRQSKNILQALRDTHEKVVVGVDSNGIALGPHTVPFGGMLDDFPTQPVIPEWIARAAMPASYFKEICSRVLPARGHANEDPEVQGLLLDFDFYMVDGEQRPLCTAVATSDRRMHILRLPQMMLETKRTRIGALPPTTIVAAGFFGYMRAIINHEWAALEFSDDRLVAKGKDFIVVAKTLSEGRHKNPQSWRRHDVDYPGCWMASHHELERIIKATAAKLCRLQIDALKERLVISSTDAKIRYRDEIPIRRSGGPARADLVVERKVFLDGVRACSGGVIRLEVEHDMKKQQGSPIVLRGEDEQFKAVINTEDDRCQ